MTRLFVTILLISIGYCSSAQNNVKWQSWDQGIELAKNTQKKILVDLYTDWCKWCKTMESTTFQDPKVVSYLNDHFVVIKFNAEQKEDIQFKGQSFKFVKGGRSGYHTLAAMLSSGRLSYPTSVFLDENGDVIQAIPGFLDAKTMEQVLIYFNGNFHQTTPWDVFQKDFDKYEDQVKKNKDVKLVKGN